MSVLVRQVAWLDASVKRHAKDDSGRPQATRRSMLEALGVEPELPAVEGAPHLVEYLFDVGPALADGGGPVSIDDAHLLAWQQNTGFALKPWESRALRRLSRDYLDELRLAEERDRPSPWSGHKVNPFSAETKASIRAMAKL